MQITSDILEFCVLACLKKEDLYGYALTTKVQSKIQISESTLYPVLKRLQKKEFLTTYDINYQGRNRRYYQITDKGITEFQNFIIEWKELKAQIESFYMEVETND